MSLMACKWCRFCVVDGPETGRCHREAPIMLRGSEQAVWPKVELDAPGCGKGKPLEPREVTR